MDTGRVVVEVPVRVADVGGWTDTWFGAPGRVCNLAVGPGVTVEVARRGAAGVRLALPDLGEVYDATTWPGRHPLVEQAIASVLDGAAPLEAGLDLTVRSAVPPGASLGTSAAVVVAVLGAVEVALGRDLPAGADLAARAHRVETDRAHRESGVQDQWAAACGGASLLAVGPYPEVRRTEVDVPAAAWDALGARLVTVVLGAHDSSSVHRQVIDAIVGCGGERHDQARRCFGRLVALAGDAAATLGAGDLAGWGTVIAAATETQADLAPGLVGTAHRRAIDVARAHGALGWKVNGAGGAGGSLTALAPDAAAAAATRAAWAAADPGWVVPDLRPSRAGVRVVEAG